MKVVFDTNVYVSAFLIPGSLAEDAFLHAQRKHATLYTSISILTETARVLRTKFHQAEQDITAALKLIGRSARVVKPSVKIMVLEDIPDNRILECALEAEADLIVTGDRHLLRLKKFQDVAIIRVADFLRLFPDDQNSVSAARKWARQRQRRSKR
jgi:putative PIN family toxin of toxin-antitoxin system